MLHYTGFGESLKSWEHSPSPPQRSLWKLSSCFNFTLIDSSLQGVLQDVRLISGPNGYLNQCPLMGSACPTCGQFTSLQAAVQQLTETLHLLNDKVPKIINFLSFTVSMSYLQLLAAEGRISRLEECDCRKSCVVNETEHQDGAYWQIGCDMCRCRVSEL